MLSLLLSTGGIIGSCGGGSASNNPTGQATSAADFEGANDIEAIVGSAWVIKWKTINADAVYAIYSGPEENAIDLSSTIASTDDSSYTYFPENFYADGKKCFLVRVVNLSGDTNVQTQCTTEIPIGFTGLTDTLNSTPNGGWELQWQAVNVPGVLYQIYKGDSSAIDFEAPMGIETNSFFIINKEDLPISRSDEVCFVVRYLHPDLVPDTNEAQVCTPTAPAIQFDGIVAVRDLNDLKKIRVYWKPAPQESAASEAEKIIGYNIYSDTDDLLEEVIIADNPATLITHTPGGDNPLSLSENYYSFESELLSSNAGDPVPITVKAVDKFGREDTNTCIAIVNVLSGITTSTDRPEDCKAE